MPHTESAQLRRSRHIGPTALAIDGGAARGFFDALPRANPLGRLGRVEEVAAQFAFLASDEAAFINGESVIIDGGQLATQFGSPIETTSTRAPRE